MISARMARAVFFAAVGVACQGFNGGSLGNEPVPDPMPIDEPPVKKEAPAVDRPLVRLTPSALARVKDIVAKHKVPEPWALRLEASWPEGICSPQHNLEFEVDRPASEKHAFESGGIKLVVHKRQVEMLRGTEIHFGEKGGEKGFIITTPNFKGEALEKWGPVLRADPLSVPKKKVARKEDS